MLRTVQRYLIVTGDDLGIAHDVDRATLDAAERGLVRSVEIMAPAPTFFDAAAALSPSVDVGVHLTLTSEMRTCRWGPITGARSLCRSDGTFHAEVGPLRDADPTEIVGELDAQLARVIDAGLSPTHLTQHMFALDEALPLEHPAWAWLARVCTHHRMAARITSPSAATQLRQRGVHVVDRVLTATHDVAARDKQGAYDRMLRATGPGFTELIVHCGYDTPQLREVTASADRRQRDHALMVGDELAPALEGIEVVSYRAMIESSRGPRE